MVDIIEESAKQEFDMLTATGRLLSALYSKMAEHREALGFPAGGGGGGGHGGKTVPMLYVTNDLAGKWVSCLQLLTRSGVRLEPGWLLGVTRDLVASYDEHGGDSCCHFWHGMPKAAAEAALARLEQQQQHPVPAPVV